MTYQTFLQTLTDTIEVRLPEKTHVRLRKIPFNNNTKRDGLSFSSEEQCVSPLIYLDHCYDRCTSGQQTIESAADEIISRFYQASSENHFDQDSVRDFASVRQHIVYRLINFEKNREALKTMPHIPYLDLAIVFGLMVSVKGENDGIIRIENMLSEYWDVSARDLWDIAHENTCSLLPPKFASMVSLLEEFFPDTTLYEEPLAPSAEELIFPLYVLTNENKFHGSAVVLYEGLLETIAKKLDGSFYILPSSVHEVILLKEEDAPDMESMNGIITSCNRDFVIPEEYLSDHAYYYDRRTKRVEAAPPA